MSDQSPATPLRPPPPYLVASLLLAACAAFLLQRWFANPTKFLHSLVLEDQPLYARAVDNWNHGIDAYQTVYGPLRFVYPPVVLYAAGALSHIISGTFAWLFYAIIHIGCTIALPLVLSRYYLRQTWMNPAFALLIFFAEPRFTGFLALESGNIACTLYLVAFLAALPGLRENRWTLFYIAVFIAAIIKAPLLLLLLLPLLAGRSQWRNSILCGIAVMAVYALQRFLLPGLYAGYQAALVNQIQVSHNYGYSVLGIAAGWQYKVSGTVGRLPGILAGIFSLALLTTLFVLRPRIHQPAQNRLWLSMILLSIVLITPRILHYDADIALLAAFVIFVYAFRVRRLIILLLVLLVPSFAVPLVIHTLTLHGAYETFILTTAFVAGAITLWYQPESPDTLDLPSR